MSKPGMTLADHMKARAAELEKNCEQHPSLETLTDYSLGNLEESQAEELRKHLAYCRTCTDQFLTIQAPLDFALDLSLTERPAALSGSVPDETEPPPEITTTDEGTQDPARITLPATTNRFFSHLIPIAAALLLGLLLGTANPFNKDHQTAAGQENETYVFMTTERTNRNADHLLPLPSEGQRIILASPSFDAKGATVLTISIQPERENANQTTHQKEVPLRKGGLLFTVAGDVFKTTGTYKITIKDAHNDDRILKDYYIEVTDNSRN